MLRIPYGQIMTCGEPARNLIISPNNYINDAIAFSGGSHS